MKRPVRRRNGLLIVAAILIVAALTLGACGGEEGDGGASPTSAGTPKPGGTYNYVLGADPVAIDPVQAYEDQGLQVAYQCFQGLVQGEVDAQGNLVAAPGLAESWDTTDNQTYTFHLKQGITFAPPVSREVTAQDFVDSWTYVTDPANASAPAYILNSLKGVDSGGYQVDPKKGLTGVKAVDKYTLEVTLQYPFGDFINSLLHPVSWVMPVDYLKKVGYKAFALKPVGTGQYMVEVWNHKRNIELVKNPKYWDAANAGYVDRIHMPVIVSDQTQWLEFQKGALDYTYVPPGQIRAAKNMPQSKSGKWTAKGWVGLNIDYVVFNMNDKVVGGTQGLNLRKAMYMAADAQSVINIVHEGEAVPATGFTPQGLPGWAPNMSPYKCNDPAGAKEILGSTTVPALNYWYNTNESNQKTAEVLQAGWKDVGINVSLSNFEWATFLDKTSKGQGQVYRSSWVADFPSLDNFLYPLFQSEQPPQINNAFYNNPAFDAKIQEARSTSDEQQRYNLYHEAEKMMLADAPVICLNYPRDFRATNNRIGGFDRDPQGFTKMWKVWVK